METQAVPTAHMAAFAGFRSIMDPKERFYRHFQEEITSEFRISFLNTRAD